MKMYHAMAKLYSKNTDKYVQVKKLGVNFINVLRAAFMPADTKSAKKTVKSSNFFALLGSASVKAARRMLVKLTLGRTHSVL